MVIFLEGYVKEVRAFVYEKSTYILVLPLPEKMCLDAFNKIVLTNKEIGLYSLWAGGATAAASCRWSFISKKRTVEVRKSKSGYAHENTPVLLQVTMYLGL